MSEKRGKAPRRRHFLHRTTTDKLARALDEADQQGLDVVIRQYVGGRDWVLVTCPAPILGPAGKKLFQPRDNDDKE